MVRADEIREVLSTMREPFDACRELTDRANRAGGHDNITVIVAEFDGPALKDPTPEQTVSYQKYALPEAPVEMTVRAVAVPAEQPSAPEASQEGQRESRRLRVGHTMVGGQVPASLAAATATGAASAPKSSLPPPVFNMDNEPVQIPTTGLPPSIVGIMVLSAMLLVAFVGYLLVR
jgi:protein phosphatase